MRLLLPLVLAVAASAEQVPSILEGWVVGNHSSPSCNFSCQVAAGLINRAQQRPAAWYGQGTWGSDIWLEQVQRFDAIANRTTYSQVSASELMHLAVRSKAAVGAVLYDCNADGRSVATVVTLCGVHRALPLADAVAAAALQLPVVFDARARWSTTLQASQWAVDNLLPNTSRHAVVLQKPIHLLTGFLADLVVAGWPGDAEALPLLAIWPEEGEVAPGVNPTVPTICNLSHPAHKLFGELTEGALGTAHGWIGPGEAGRTMPTVIGYHDTGPGAWTECLNLCTPKHRTISLVANVASNLGFFSRAAPVTSLPAPHPPIPAGPYDPAATYISIINSDGDNIAFDEVRVSVTGNDMKTRDALCNKHGAVCPPMAHTMSNRMMDLAPTILQWWYSKATPADSFVLGPSGYGYTYPALMDATDQTAFANATAHAAKRLGMGGYVHWDFVGDFLGKPFTRDGAGSLNFLKEVAKAWGADGVALLGGPSGVGPSPQIPDRVKPDLAVVKPISLRDLPISNWDRYTPAANVSASLLALPRGTISYIYKIWDVGFAAVEELGVALKGTHVKLVDVRAIPELVRAKAASVK